MACQFRNTLLIFVFLIASLKSNGQGEFPDSASKPMNEIVITAFEQSSEQTLNVSRLAHLPNTTLASNKSSLVRELNTIAGVRMEERSPGSYRLNIRGSSLRSPFGVRNVKVYWNGLPVTDPGGNTYFNQFAQTDITSIEISKGPASSMYGAGTGGLVLMRSLDGWTPRVSVEFEGGSFHLNNILTTFSFGSSEHRNKIIYAHNENLGYRDHSKMNRNNFSWVNMNRKEGKYEFISSFLFTHLYYQTPGALTLSEYLINPRSARPAVRTLPSAATAEASITQDNLLAGLSTKNNITPDLINATSLYVAVAQIANPTFRNYEHRSEPSVGGRTSFIWSKKDKNCEYKIVAGTEIQNGYFNTTTSRNKQGTRDTLLTDDDIRYNVYSVFLQGDVSLNHQWFLTTGISSGSSHVIFTRLNKYPVVKQERSYNNEYSPRISVLKKFNNLSVSAIISRGYSPPGIGELLPSTSVISTNLEAEHGSSYELKGSYKAFNNSLNITVESFYFKLTDALVQRRDANGADYFINAGNVNQQGIEIMTNYNKPIHLGFLDHISVNLAYTYDHFTYGTLQKDSTVLTGNRLPGIPSNTVSLVLDISGKKKWYLNISNYYSSKIFLNDSNSAKANSYLLLGSKIGSRVNWGKMQMNIYAGADNLLNESYSLGNDLNDVNGRFYNAAPKRNYYAGVGFDLCTKK